MIDSEPVKAPTEIPDRPASVPVKPEVTFKPVIEGESRLGFPVRAVDNIATTGAAYDLQGGEEDGYIYVNIARPPDQPPHTYFSSGPSHDVIKEVIAAQTDGLDIHHVLGGQLHLDAELGSHSINFENTIGRSRLQIAQTLMTMISSLPPELFYDGKTLQISHFGHRSNKLPNDILYREGELFAVSPGGIEEPLLDDLESLLS